MNHLTLLTFNMTQEERRFCEILIFQNGTCPTDPCSSNCPWVKNDERKSTCTVEKALTWAKEALVDDVLELPEHVFNPFTI